MPEHLFSRGLGVARFLGCVAAAVTLPVVAAGMGAALAVADLSFRAFGRRRPVENVAVRRNGVSVVIPTWNGLHLLQTHLPSVVAALGDDPRNELIVVDNLSTDGTRAYLDSHFPHARVLAQTRNLGFGGGSNAGFRAAKNDIVVLLNNDMRVEPDFLAPLVTPFRDAQVFAVTCQIFLADSQKVREETGLTSTCWRRGRVSVTHHVDPEIEGPFPCAYPGGGSSAFDRRKFLELGGFDEVFRPFYYEDTDLGHLAWKRGWKVLYEPRSVVHHEHRATIGGRFSRDEIDVVLERNVLMFACKNIADWRMLAGALWRVVWRGVGGTLARRRKGWHVAVATWRVATCFGEALRSRWRAKSLAVISDAEVFRRQRGGYYRDRFEAALETPQRRLQVLFISPYAIAPATHGGAVFMREAIEKLRTHCDVHLLLFVANEAEKAAQEALRTRCASLTVVVRRSVKYRVPWGLRPRVVREFWDERFAWALDRLVFEKNIDVVQIEYIQMAQYRGGYRHIPCFLFEHDVAFQSLGRQLRMRLRLRSAVAWLQLRHYELGQLRLFARVQVCTEENRRYLIERRPELAARVDADERAVIDVRQYQFVRERRAANGVLFIGSFAHGPNVEGLNWLLTHVWPRVLKMHSEARLMVAGAGDVGALRKQIAQPGVEFLGLVPDVKRLLEQQAVMVAPILSGSGIRVKLLEAFAAGIPAVATRLGAEGLIEGGETCCELADAPEEFARAIVQLLRDTQRAAHLAERARHFVERRFDSVTDIARLAASYAAEVERRRPHPAGLEVVEGDLSRAVRGSSVLR